MINVEKITKSFEKLNVLSNISFKIGKGEIVALLGPNGAGKTTLIRLMTGILAPDKGTIYYDEENIQQQRVSILKKIGYIPENAPLYKEMTPYEYLKYTGSLWNIKEQTFKERLQQLLTKLDLLSVINRPISELSKGYRHRVAIAGALIHGPEILILDEPSEGLDPNQKYGLRQFLKEFALQGTVILSTHIMEDVEAIANRVILIKNGSVIADTTPIRLKYQMPEKDLISAFRRLMKD